MPKVSVLMPVYNVKEEYLRESIESILNQTFKDFEFIILDDCSENDVEAIVKSYKDERIKFYRNAENSGIAITRNRLMSLAKGEYCALMDNDDISLPDRLKKQVEFLDKNQDVSILSTAYETFPEKRIIVHPKSVRYLDLYNGCVVTHPAAIFRTESLRKFDLKYDESFICSQDYELWSRAIRFLKIANLDEVLLKYRLYPESLTQKRQNLAQNEDKRIRTAMLNFLTNDIRLQQQISDFIMGVSEISEVKRNISFKNIFSVRNVENHKVLTICGIKFKFRKGKQSV